MLTGELGKGDFFGERELLSRSDPISSVVVIDFLEAFELVVDAFETVAMGLGLTQPLAPMRAPLTLLRLALSSPEQLYHKEPTFKALIDAGVTARREQEERDRIEALTKQKEAPPKKR